MIEGHGDDAYRYGDIKSDFSSNICAHGNHQALMNHLMAHPELISHYPEPEAWSLETVIAERYGLQPQQVIVTSGATEAIYLIAQTFRMQSEIPSPTFSEYEDACQLFSPFQTKRCSGCAPPTILQAKFMRHHLWNGWRLNTIC